MALLQIKKLGTLGEMPFAVIAFACFGVSFLSVCGQPVHFLERLSRIFECDLTLENRIRENFVGEEDFVRIGCRFTNLSDFGPVLIKVFVCLKLFDVDAAVTFESLKILLGFRQLFADLSFAASFVFEDRDLRAWVIKGF